MVYIFVFAAGVVVGVIATWAIERRRFEALLSEQLQIAAATVAILDALFSIIGAHSDGGGTPTNG